MEFYVAKKKQTMSDGFDYNDETDDHHDILAENVLHD